MKFIYTALIFIASHYILNAQNAGFIIEPLSSQPYLFKKNTEANTRTVRPDSINLPFVEDFSYDGPFPDENLWMDKSVFVNYTMAVNPPSVGIATFDAIKANGAAYSRLVNDTGWADTLTSNFINLANYSETNGQPRPLVLADSIYMSFFLQPKGLSYQPYERDSLVLEFKDKNGEWNSIQTFKGYTKYIGLDTFPPFTMNFVKINDSKYLYGKFQFRFRFYTRLDGITATWHLDYIKIAPNRRINTRTLDDLTFVDIPRPLLKRYTAMPWKQAKPQINTEFRDTIDAKFYNHFAQTRNPTSTNAKVSASNGPDIIPTQTIADGQTANIPAGQYYSTFKKYLTTYFTEIDKIEASVENLKLTTEYSLEIESQEGRDLYQNATRNDKIKQTTTLTDYYAYDDGTGEMQLTATGINTISAVKFRANVDDKLRGFMAYFPHINADAEKMRYNFRVYEDSAGLPKATPIFEQKNLRPFYTDARFDTLQGFTTQRLEGFLAKDTAIDIKKGDFYIAWQNVGDVRIPVGLDRNNRPAMQYFYQFLSGRWEAATDRFGAVMIRPLFSKTTPQNTNSTKDILLSNIMSIYPNPVQDRLFIDFKNNDFNSYEFVIHNLNGQLLNRIELRGGALQVEGLRSGFYILKIRDLKNNQTYFHKFVKQ